MATERQLPIAPQCPESGSSNDHLPSVRLTRINSEAGYLLTFMPLRHSIAHASAWAPPGEINIILNPWPCGSSTFQQSPDAPSSASSSTIQKKDEGNPLTKVFQDFESWKVPDMILLSKLPSDPVDMQSRSTAGVTLPQHWCAPRTKLQKIFLTPGSTGAFKEILASESEGASAERNESLPIEDLWKGYPLIEQFYGEGWVVRLEVIYLRPRGWWTRVSRVEENFAIGLRFMTYFMAESPIRQHYYQVMIVPNGAPAKVLTDYLVELDRGDVIDLLLHPFSHQSKKPLLLLGGGGGGGHSLGGAGAGMLKYVKAGLKLKAVADMRHWTKKDFEDENGVSKAEKERLAREWSELLDNEHKLHDRGGGTTGSKCRVLSMECGEEVDCSPTD